MKSEKIAFDVVFTRVGYPHLMQEVVWAYTEDRAREYLQTAFEDFEEIVSIDKKVQ